MTIITTTPQETSVAQPRNFPGLTGRKPFMKYPGRKDRIITSLAALLPPGGRLIDAFCGSGAVSLGLDYPAYWLNDADGDLINLFAQVANRPTFIDECEHYFTDQRYRSERMFLNLRSIFRGRCAPDHELAAILLYLGRFGFNGLHRKSSRGRYNVAYGWPERFPDRTIYFPRRELLSFREFAKSATFTAHDFRDVLPQARRGDVVYCDPPYVPLSETSNFTAYNGGSFGVADALDLNRLAMRLANRGICTLVSNSDTPVTRQLFSGARRVIEIAVQRNIAGKAENRGEVGELLLLYHP